MQCSTAYEKATKENNSRKSFSLTQRLLRSVQQTRQIKRINAKNLNNIKYVDDGTFRKDAVPIYAGNPLDMRGKLRIIE